MKQLVLSQFPWPTLPSLALLIFFTFFVMLFVVTHFRAKTPIYRRASQLPLEDATRSSDDV